MTEDEQLAAAARAVVDANLYMVLGWVSRPEREHSRNLAARPEVKIVIFDSRVPISTATGQAVYLSALAEELTGAEIDRGIGIFSDRSQLHGGAEWTRADVQPPSRLRLYRATVAESFLLGEGDNRLPVTMHS